MGFCQKCGMVGVMRGTVAISVLAIAAALQAQTSESQSLGGLTLSEISALDAAPDLAAWRSRHPNEHLKTAAYDNEYESQGLWCAASVADFDLPGGIHVTRQAFFYIPIAKPAESLPVRQDTDLVRQCRLRAFWYEVKNPADVGALANAVSAEFGATLGPGVEPPRFKRTDGDWGSGYWSPYEVWEGPERRLVLAVDPGGPVPDPRAHTRLLVIARSSLAPRGVSYDWMGGTPKGQPAFQDPAEQARVAKAESPCSFDDINSNWQTGLIRFGEGLLRDFPASRSAPYIHLTLARTYASSLALTYPNGNLGGSHVPDDPDALRRGAIAHFRAFLEGNRESPEAGSAWREAWRLLAGLPPSPIHFGCND